MVNFIDAQQMAQQYPETFSAPSLKELQDIKIGHFVRNLVPRFVIPRFVIPLGILRLVIPQDS